MEHCDDLEGGIAGSGRQAHPEWIIYLWLICVVV